MLGLKCRASNLDVVQAGYEAELITVPAADNVVRLLPPLTLSDTEVDAALDRLDRVARAVAGIGAASLPV